MAKESQLTCSFCGKPQSEAKKIIAGGGGTVHICSACVRLCQRVLDEANIDVDSHVFSDSCEKVAKALDVLLTMKREKVITHAEFRNGARLLLKTRLARSRQRTGSSRLPQKSTSTTSASGSRR